MLPPPILDDNEEPRLFFHGSCREIRAFGKERYDGVGGIYFALSHEDAADYAEMSCIEEGDVATVMTVHLRIANPYRMTGIESQEISHDRIAELKAMGHDGVIGSSDEGAEYEYVAFDPEQIVIVSCDAVSQPGPRL